MYQTCFYMQKFLQLAAFLSNNDVHRSSKPHDYKHRRDTGKLTNMSQLQVFRPFDDLNRSRYQYF